MGWEVEGTGWGWGVEGGDGGNGLGVWGVVPAYWHGIVPWHTECLSQVGVASHLLRQEGGDHNSILPVITCCIEDWD